MMRQATFLTLLLFSAVLITSAQTDLPPKGWKWVNPCSASFLIPSKLERQKGDGIPIDSCFATYGSGKLVVSVNEDNYAPSFERSSDWQDYTESPIAVAHLTGQLITFKMPSGRDRDKLTNFTVLRLGIVRDNAATFTLRIRADLTVDPDTVNKIRESVRFKRPSTEPQLAIRLTVECLAASCLS